VKMDIGWEPILKKYYTIKMLIIRLTVCVLIVGKNDK
jgi:hypothetical protein